METELKVKQENSNEDVSSMPSYSKRYLIILIIILGLAHVSDEYASLAPSWLPTLAVKMK